MKINYFPSSYAVKMHDKIIDISGGILGIKEYGNIDSPLVHIQNDEYYPTFEEKLAHLIFAFNKFHAFNDGNKRTSIAMGAFLLEINGLEALIDKFIIEMENIAVAVADNIIDKNFLLEIITSIMNEEEYSEGLKLKILNALQNAQQSSISVNFGSDFYKELF